jgi:hypothetical protein
MVCDGFHGSVSKCGRTWCAFSCSHDAFVTYRRAQTHARYGALSRPFDIRVTVEIHVPIQRAVCMSERGLMMTRPAVADVNQWRQT